MRYQLRASLLDSGTIVQKAVQFVNSQINTRGLTTKNNEVIIDNTAKSTEKMEKVGNVSTEHKQSH